jgi:hypothetical protein
MMIDRLCQTQNPSKEVNHLLLGVFEMEDAVAGAAVADDCFVEFPRQAYLVK